MDLVLSSMTMHVTASAGEEAVRMIPDLVWIAFAILLLYVFYRPIRYELLPRLSTLKLPGGIELSLKNRIGNAATRQRVQVSEDDKTRIVQRLQRLAPLVHEASILWIDDTPENNVNEASILTAFGATVETATTSDDADQKLRKDGFDVIISDVRREGQDDAGVRFVERRKGVPYTILYVGEYDEARGTPPYAFAMTNRPHQLLHYVLDALERQRG